MKVPQCLNTNFFETVIRNGFNLTNFQIVQVQIEIGTSAGDNYCSTIYRVFLDVTDSEKNVQKVQFLVKHLLNSETGGSIMEFMNVFDKEIDMFKNILPMLTKISGGIQFGARYLRTCL